MSPVSSQVQIFAPANTASQLPRQGQRICATRRKPHPTGNADHGSGRFHAVCGRPEPTDPR